MKHHPPLCVSTLSPPPPPALPVVEENDTDSYAEGSDTHAAAGGGNASFYGLGKLMRLPNMKIPMSMTMGLVRPKEDEAGSSEDAQYLEAMKMQLAELSARLTDSQEQVGVIVVAR